MSVIALLSVSPVREGSMAPDVARAVDALDSYDVTYETTAMGTIIEGSDVEEVFAASAAAHQAVDADRVSTLLKIDHKRGDGTADEKVQSVEAELGRPAHNRD